MNDHMITAVLTIGDGLSTAPLDGGNLRGTAQIVDQYTHDGPFVASVRDQVTSAQWVITIESNRTEALKAHLRSMWSGMASVTWRQAAAIVEDVVPRLAG
jgi:fatty acid/phospholipid biosynthesis enzyme